MQVFSFSLKKFMIFYADLYIKISSRAVLFSYLSLAGNTQAHPIFNAGRDRDFKFFFSSYYCFSSAIITGILRKFSFSMAVRAWTSLLKQAEGSTLGPFHIT